MSELPAPSDPDSVTELPAPSDPMGVARKIIDGYRHERCLTLRHWRGSWMRWDRASWIEDEDLAVRAWLYAKLDKAEYAHVDPKTKESERRPWRPNRRKVADLLDALAAVTHLGEGIDPPTWLDDTSPVPAGELVACANGLLHVGTRGLTAHTPRYFNRVAVPFDFDPDVAPPARWLEFLSQLWPEDPDSIAVLQEFFGYVLSGRTDLHKIMLLVGPTRSGKGTIARVLAALVGKGNAAGPTLASLGTPFGLSPLLGKPLALVSDARLGGADVHQVVERLLSISGEDMLTIDRKYRESWTGKLTSRFLILSNELPRFGDASGAIAARFVVLTLAQSWLGQEDPELTAHLLDELPGILTWSLDGLDRLARNGKFTESPSSSDAVLALQDLVSPMAAFVRDECTVGAGHEIVVSDLYTAWRTWCEDNGRDRPGTLQTFGRDLRAVIPQLRVQRPRDPDDPEKRLPRQYVGITLQRNTPHNGRDRGPLRSGTGQQPDTDRSAPPDRDGPRSRPLWGQRSQAEDDGWVTVFDHWVRAHVIRDPRPVGAIATDLGVDSWAVQAALDRLVERGDVIRHAPTSGPPTWSLPSETARPLVREGTP